MTTSTNVGPGPEAIVNHIRATYPETDIIEMGGAWFFSLDPEKHWPNYATIVTDDDHDTASNLSRPGVYRLNLGLDRATFERVVAAEPEPDYTAFDRVPPTPSTVASSGSAS
jgi:hypothetical protein